MYTNAMSQNDDTTTDAQSETDLAEMTGTLADVSDALDTLSPEEIEAADDEKLAELRNAIRNIENAAEDTRKDTVENELKTRVEPGDSIAGLSLIEVEKTNVPDESAVIDMMRSAGRPPENVMEVKAGKVEDLAAEAEGITTEPLGTYSYTYFASH
jgi:transcriptional accessory protein Tex/SPT6